MLTLEQQNFGCRKAQVFWEFVVMGYKKATKPVWVDTSWLFLKKTHYYKTFFLNIMKSMLSWRNNIAFSPVSDVKHIPGNVCVRGTVLGAALSFEVSMEGKPCCFSGYRLSTVDWKCGNWCKGLHVKYAVTAGNYATNHWIFHSHPPRHHEMHVLDGELSVCSPL